LKGLELILVRLVEWFWNYVLYVLFPSFHWGASLSDWEIDNPPVCLVVIGFHEYMIILVTISIECLKRRLWIILRQLPQMIYVSSRWFIARRFSNRGWRSASLVKFVHLNLR
jgi:hypothetical protein